MKPSRPILALILNVFGFLTLIGGAYMALLALNLTSSAQAIAIAAGSILLALLYFGLAQVLSAITATAHYSRLHYELVESTRKSTDEQQQSSAYPLSQHTSRISSDIFAASVVILALVGAAIYFIANR